MIHLLHQRADSKRALKYYRKALTLFSLGLGAGAGAAAAAAEAGTVHETSSSRAAQTALAVPLKLKVVLAMPHHALQCHTLHYHASTRLYTRTCAHA